MMIDLQRDERKQDEHDYSSAVGFGSTGQTSPVDLNVQEVAVDLVVIAIGNSRDIQGLETDSSRAGCRDG
jgi:hypothetical protein